MGGRPSSGVTGPAAVSRELPCGWCGVYTRRGPFCESCGSPMPASFSLGADGALIARRTKKKPPPVIAVRAEADPRARQPLAVAKPPEERKKGSGPRLDWERETLVPATPAPPPPPPPAAQSPPPAVQ